MTSAGTSCPLWWNVFDTLRRPTAPPRHGPCPAPTIGRRLDQLAEPVAWWQRVQRPSPTSTTGGSTVRHRSVGQRAAVDEDARRQVRPDLGQVAGDRRQRSLRLADAVARQRAQQAERVRVLRALEDGRRVALLDDLAGVHHPDPVAQRPDDARGCGRSAGPPRSSRPGASARGRARSPRPSRRARSSARRGPAASGPTPARWR